MDILTQLLEIMERYVNERGSSESEFAVIKDKISDSIPEDRAKLLTLGWFLIASVAFGEPKTRDGQTVTATDIGRLIVDVTAAWANHYRTDPTLFFKVVEGTIDTPTLDAPKKAKPVIYSTIVGFEGNA